jgi:16S rRNA (cytidine1402-2'-O)-methyltransferase
MQLWVMEKPLEPGLYVVATPIGNLGDLSLRAAETLRKADLILAEDTRVTGKLLAHVRAKAPMRRYDDHSRDSDRKRIVDRLGNEAIAIVSDAGTPLISDPGFKLVRAARDAGRLVTTVPGPCAAIAGLSISGLPTDRFLFLGFLPAKAKARSDAIAEIANVRATLILYESGQRLGDTLRDLLKVLGDRDAIVARELTKLYEESFVGTLTELAKRFEETIPKGEIVIVVGPPEEAETATDDTIDRMLESAMERLSPSRAAAEVAEQLNVPRKRAYERALDLSKK